MMKMQICGIEITEGVSKKTGKAYAMGRLHTLIQLAPAHGEGNVAKGLVGTTYECDVNLLRKVEHLPFPVMADVEVAPVMRFGERQELVVDVRPLEVVKKAA
jgi:hypothetical protein